MGLRMGSMKEQKQAKRRRSKALTPLIVDGPESTEAHFVAPAPGGYVPSTSDHTKASSLLRYPVLLHID